MLEKIENGRTMTVKEMKKVYSDKWFRYILEGEPCPTNPLESTGTVVYVSDRENEIFEPIDMEVRLATIVCSGERAYRPETIGGFSVYE